MDEKTRTRQLETLSIGRLLLMFSIPATLGTMVNATYNLIDRIFVGRYVGELGLAATTVSFPVMMIMMAFGMMIGFGSNTLISIRLGEKEYDQAERVVGQALLLFLILAVFFVFFGLLFLEPLLGVFGASDEVMPYGKQYLSIIISGVLFHEISFGVNSFIRGEGNPRVAMMTMLISALLNIFLDYLFIVQFDWGIRGAAFATVIAQSVATAWICWYYLSGRSTLRWRWRNLRLEKPLLRKVFLLGLPPFIMSISNCVLQAFLNNRLGTYGGDRAIAVMGIIFAIFMVMFMPLLGISQGLQPIVGYNTGAKQYRRIRQALKLALLVASILSFCYIIPVQFFPEALFSLFARNNSDLIELGSYAIRRFLVMLPLIGVVIIGSYYYQATGRPMISLFLSMTRQVLILLPLIIVLPLFLGLDGIWIAGPISDTGAFLATSTLLFFEFRRLRRKAETTSAPDPKELFHQDDSMAAEEPSA
jgi:putative MATE family efflux protein